MLITTILFVVTFASSGISKFVNPNLQQNFDDPIYYKLNPPVSSSNEEYHSLAKRTTADKNPMYWDEQKLDGIFEHSDEKEKRTDTGSTDDVKHDDVKREEEDQESKSDAHNEDGGNSKSRETNEDEHEKANNLSDENTENEEINVDSENSKETDDTHSENFEDFEDHDAFKWPNENEWYGKYSTYKDDGDGSKIYGRFGKYGMYDSYDKFGKHSDYGGYRRYGCLELGHGEYC